MNALSAARAPINEQRVGRSLFAVMRAVRVLRVLWTLSIAAWTLSALLPGQITATFTPTTCSAESSSHAQLEDLFVEILDLNERHLGFRSSFDLRVEKLSNET